MRRTFFGILISLTLLFAGAIGLIRAQPYTTSQLDAFLTPPAYCSTPCFLGVRPQHMTVQQALAVLRANKNIQQVHVDSSFSDQTIYWRWRTDPDAYRRFAFNAQDNIILQPVLPYDLTLGEAQLVLGKPAVVSAGILNGYIRRPAVIFEYPEHGLHLIVALYPCQIDQGEYWQLNHQTNGVGGFAIIMGDADFSQMIPQTRQLLDHTAWAKQMRDFCRMEGT
jgi:hypothetical protein